MRFIVEQFAFSFDDEDNSAIDCAPNVVREFESFQEMRAYVDHETGELPEATYMVPCTALTIRRTS